MDSQTLEESERGENHFCGASLPLTLLSATSSHNLRPHTAAVLFPSCSFDSPQREGKKPVSLLTSSTTCPQILFHPFPTTGASLFALLIFPVGGAPTSSSCISGPCAVPDPDGTSPQIGNQEAFRGSLWCLAEGMLDWVYRLPEKEHCHECLGISGIGE